MTDDEALGLIQSLKDKNVVLRQRGRLLHVERGAENVSARLREVIARNWGEVALAASAHRQADRLLADVARKGKQPRKESTPC